ncbi:hypothetical protein QTP88_019382 [Uroleucon formosanum]
MSSNHSNISNENNEGNNDGIDSRRNTDDAVDADMSHINSNIFHSTYRLVVSDKHDKNAEE